MNTINGVIHLGSEFVNKGMDSIGVRYIGDTWDGIFEPVYFNRELPPECLDNEVLQCKKDQNLKEERKHL